MGNDKISSGYYQRIKRDCLELLFSISVLNQTCSLVSVEKATRQGWSTGFTQCLQLSCRMYGILTGLLHQSTVYSLFIQVLSTLRDFHSHFPFCHWLQWGTRRAGGPCLGQCFHHAPPRLAGSCCRPIKCWWPQFVLIVSLLQKLEQFIAVLAIPAAGKAS